MIRTIALIAALIAVGGLTFDATPPHDITTTRIVYRLPPNCHPQLLAADLHILDRGYVLAITGHRRAARDEVFAHYAAISPKECR